jgi:hypothetical protein
VVRGENLLDPRQVFGSSLSNTADSNLAREWLACGTSRGAPVEVLMARLY